MRSLARHPIAPALMAVLILTDYVWSVAPKCQGRPATVGPQPPKAPDEDDEAAFRAAQVRRSLEENCLICHSEDMIASQRLTPAQWKSEIEKMVNWGAPLPKEAESPLIDYLARRYSAQAAPPALTRAALKDVDSLELPGAGPGVAPIDADPARGERIYAANCATCHGPTALGGDLGPSLTGKAILTHPREYDGILRQGLRRMPGFQTVMNSKDQADVLEWLRRQTFPAVSGPGRR
jgi:mono/diheme cytochrome c family protein